jgi:hemolysin III
LNLLADYHKVSKDEKANVITHFIGLMMSIIIGAPVLLYIEDYTQFWALAVFIFGMSFMFFSSTLYHAAWHKKQKKMWHLVDHFSIFILIGCSYSAFIMMYMATDFGYRFLSGFWTLILFGMFFKFIFKEKYETVIVCLYLLLGWLVIAIIKQITYNMKPEVITLLISGGIAYTIGVYFFVHSEKRYYHFIWHIFVMLGCFSHFSALCIK